MDTWILLRPMESNGERNRGLWILKSRGMAHSNQIREFLITNHGIDLLDVYLGAEGVLTGSARAAREAREKAEALLRRQDIERKPRNMERRSKALEARMTALRAQFEIEREELEKEIREQKRREGVIADNRVAMPARRKADASSNNRLRSQKGSRNAGGEIH
jgi:circadian clock protein KaiC